ncbi:hypothetical protein Tco_1479040, partial [Tanacetum coccineum]
MILCSSYTKKPQTSFWRLVNNFKMFKFVNWSKATLDHLLTSVLKQNSGWRKLKAAGVQHISKVSLLFRRYNGIETKAVAIKGNPSFRVLIQARIHLLQAIAGGEQ